MKVAAVDIGTNSMRLLMVHQVGDGPVELGRYERVTGLGRGVDATGELSQEAMDRTLLALSEFGGPHARGRSRAPTGRCDFGFAGRPQPGQVLRSGRVGAGGSSRDDLRR